MSAKIRKHIENTSRTGVNSAWMGGNPKEIEAQESRGQDQLVNSHDLPVECRPDRTALEMAGVTFGASSQNDRLFCRAELPSGWTRLPTDRSMWSQLVDDQGRVRADIFYKAAFYDRSAFMNVVEVD